MLYAILTIAAGLLLFVPVVLHMRRERDKQRDMLNRLRSSGMYSGVYRMLTSLDPKRVERVTIQPDGIDVMLLPGRQLRYDFAEHRIDPLQPTALLTLTQAIAVDLPFLQDPRHYTFQHTSRKARRPAYFYTMKPDRKDYLLRSMNGR